MLNPLQYSDEYIEKYYNQTMKNAKQIKKLLEKSGLNKKYLEKIKFVLKNWTLEKAKNIGLYEYCRENGVYGMDGISKPTKITTFSKSYLDLLKNMINGKAKDEYLHSYGKYDYTIHIGVDENGDQFGYYSAEYKGCGNGYYSLLLDNQHYLFIEKD